MNFHAPFFHLNETLGWLKYEIYMTRFRVRVYETALFIKGSDMKRLLHGIRKTIAWGGLFYKHSLSLYHLARYCIYFQKPPHISCNLTPFQLELFLKYTK